MEEKIWKKNITSSSIWVRGFFMILFYIVGYIIRFLVVLISIFQFIYTICTGKPNGKLIQFGSGLANFVYQIVMFITFNTETKPYPFSEWGAKVDQAPAKVEQTPVKKSD